MPTVPLSEVDHALRVVIARRLALNTRIADDLLACVDLDGKLDELLAMRTEAVSGSV